MRCSSCNLELETEERWTRFKCPACGENEIKRCDTCRKRGILYRCECGFEGP
ncbi:MAG: DUF1610 domain-containing protein [Candidatus Aenigmarchaeota archaeon]|nr:DUF1610 domain-containing protein [Candidatus Aenigmarchaeota archaeon]